MMSTQFCDVYLTGAVNALVGYYIGCFEYQPTDITYYKMQWGFVEQTLLGNNNDRLCMKLCHPYYQYAGTEVRSKLSLYNYIIHKQVRSSVTCRITLCSLFVMNISTCSSHDKIMYYILCDVDGLQKVHNKMLYRILCFST